MIDHRLRQRGWRVVHPGVYALTTAPLTRRQLWIAATLTTPDSVLSHARAAAFWEIRPFEASFETVTRPGSGGPRRLGSVLVCRSKQLDGHVTCHDGIRVTTPVRTLIDLAPHLNARALRKTFREALRLETTTRQQLVATLSRHRGRRGTRLLDDLATRYPSVAYHRTRSDAEARALELLHDAGVAPPLANTRIAGEEADLMNNGAARRFGVRVARWPPSAVVQTPEETTRSARHGRARPRGALGRRSGAQAATAL